MCNGLEHLVAKDQLPGTTGLTPAVSFLVVSVTGAGAVVSAFFSSVVSVFLSLLHAITNTDTNKKAQIEIFKAVDDSFF
jgi:hypothetical protein